MSGCQSKTSTSGPSPDNIYRVAQLAEPTTLDPGMVQDGTTIDLIQQMYEGLVQWTPQNTLAPALAKSWDISKDGLTYTFHIRPGVTFQSGAPVTADDVAFSFEHSLSPKLGSPVAMTYLADIVGASDYAAGKSKTVTGVKVIDPLTIQVKISKPKAYWLDVLTYPTAFVVNPAKLGNDPGTPITEANTDGTGPFALANYARGSYVDLKANPTYWDGAPKIAGQHRPILTDANTRHSLYLSGQLDVVDETQGSLEADLNNPQLKDQVKFWSRSATYYVGMGEQALPVFKDKRVRQAFAYATDKAKIVQVVFDNHRDVAEDILPEGLPGWSKDFKGLPYDPAKAKQLLAAAGYPDGKGFPPLNMVYRESYPDLSKTVDLLRQMYKDNLGVTVEARQTEWATELDMEDHNNLPFYHLRWSADYLDPQDYYSLLYHTGSQQNHTVYSNPQLDAICDKADSDQNPTERAALYRQAARILADDVPMIPLYYQKDPELIKPYVQGLDDSLMGHLPYKHLYLVK